MYTDLQNRIEGNGNGNRIQDVFANKLESLLKAFTRDSTPDTVTNIVLAYEPFQTNETGISLNPEQTKQVFNWLTVRLAKHINNSDKVKIISAGSDNK